jgi:hypothetical protein
MAHFNALLQHQGPLKHVNHKHRVATMMDANMMDANMMATVMAAKMDAWSFKDAASKIFEGEGGPLGQWPYVQRAMEVIMSRAHEEDYLRTMVGSLDYGQGVGYLVAFMRAQPANVLTAASVWYDMQKMTVKFMFKTADHATLIEYADPLPFPPGNYHSEPDKMLTSKLGRFQNFALSRNDKEAANMAANLIKLMLMR